MQNPPPGPPPGGQPPSYPPPGGQQPGYPPPGYQQAGGIDKKTGAILSYALWWITGIIFLFVGKNDPDVKFHAAQSTIFFGGIFIIDFILNRVAANPKLHATVYQDVRKAVVTKFPYVVIYREEAGELLVVAVFHTSRDPSVWQSRI